MNATRTLSLQALRQKVGSSDLALGTMAQATFLHGRAQGSSLTTHTYVVSRVPHIHTHERMHVVLEYHTYIRTHARTCIERDGHAHTHEHTHTRACACTHTYARTHAAQTERHCLPRWRTLIAVCFSAKLSWQTARDAVYFMLTCAIFADVHNLPCVPPLKKAVDMVNVDQFYDESAAGFVRSAVSAETPFFFYFVRSIYAYFLMCHTSLCKRRVRGLASIHLVFFYKNAWSHTCMCRRGFG